MRKKIQSKDDRLTDREIRLACGLKARIRPLQDANAKKMAKITAEAGRICSLLLDALHGRRGKCTLVTIDVNGEPLQLIYGPQKPEQQEKLLSDLKTTPKNTVSLLLFAAYRGTAYPYYHRTTHLLVQTCITGVPPGICALTTREKEATL